MRGSRVSAGVWLCLVGAVVVAAAGCTERHRWIYVFDDGPIGVGLTTSVQFWLIECDEPAPNDPAVDPFSARECSNEKRLKPKSYRVEAADTNARVLDTTLGDGPRDGPRPVEARVEALGEGTARFLVQIDDLEPVEFAIRTEPVRHSVIYPDALMYLEPGFISQHYDFGQGSIFAGTYLVFLRQSHYSVEPSNSEPAPSSEYRLRGDAPLQFVAGADLGSLSQSQYPPSSLDVGHELGTLELTTSVGGSLILDVVDSSSVVSAEVRAGGDFSPLASSVVLEQGKTYGFAVAPFDDSGHLILGDGVLPTYAEGGDVIRVLDGPTYSIGLEYGVEARSRGSTTLEFLFDGVQASVPVTVE